MKAFFGIFVFLVVCVVSLIFGEQPRYPFPKTPDQIWQNDLDLNDAIRRVNRGVTDGSNASAGDKGEYVSSSTTAGIPAATSGQYKNLVQVLLTPGDWDLNGMIDLSANGATITETSAHISAFTGNTTTDHSSGDTGGEFPLPVAASDQTAVIAGLRKNLTANTTFYLKFEMAYSVATPRAFGRISARRVR